MQGMRKPKSSELLELEEKTEAALHVLFEQLHINAEHLAPNEVKAAMAAYRAALRKEVDYEDETDS